MPALAVKCGLFLNEDNHFAYPCDSEEWSEIRTGIPTHGCWLDGECAEVGGRLSFRFERY